MDRDLIREKRRQAFIERRRKAFEKVMKNHPEGIKKTNLQQFKEEMKEEEAKLRLK